MRLIKLGEIGGDEYDTLVNVTRRYYFKEPDPEKIVDHLAAIQFGRRLGPFHHRFDQFRHVVEIYVEAESDRFPWGR